MRFSGDQIRLVTLLKKSTTHNDYNEPIEAWSADTDNDETDSNGKLYVEWWDQGGREVLTDGQTVATSDVRIKCRYIDGLNPNDYRIERDGVQYNIEQPIKEMGRREAQIVMLDARDNA